MSEIYTANSINDLDFEDIVGLTFKSDIEQINNLSDFLKDFLIFSNCKENLECLENKEELIIKMKDLSWIQEHEINIIFYNSIIKDDCSLIEKELQSLFLTELFPFWDNIELEKSKFWNIYFVKGSLSEIEDLKKDVKQIGCLINKSNESLKELNKQLEIVNFQKNEQSKLMDSMHEELQQYKNGLLDKLINGFALDIIQLVDTVEKDAKFYSEQEYNKENYNQLLSLFASLSEDLKDVLYRQGIESYSCPDNDIDVKKQKIVKIIPTKEVDKNNTIAGKISDGYEKDGKIIRPERISIFKTKK